MRIKAASAEDVETVLRLEREVPDAPHWTESEYSGIVAAEAGLVRRCLLACLRDAELVGFAVGKVVAGEAELETVVVRPLARRTGIGKALCLAVIGWAWEQGATAMELEVRASSAGARALYLRLGFVEVGRRRGYYKDPPDEAVLMRLVGAELHRSG